jgi:hypothetical protein
MDYFSIKNKLFNIIYKNNKLEESCYKAINMYLLMIFNNYTIDEIENYMGFSKIESEEKNSNMIFDRFYQDLYLLFDLEKDQKKMGGFYPNFEDSTEFNCTNIFNNYNYDVINKADEIRKDLHLKERLHDICVMSHINDIKNLKTIFEKHFQFVKNGMFSLTDFSYEGLNNHLDTTLVGRISIFFFSITIYIIEVTTSIPHKDSVNKLMILLRNRILFTGIIFVIFEIGLILTILFFYIYNINKFCNQIALLKKTFNLFENHDQ